MSKIKGIKGAIPKGKNPVSFVAMIEDKTVEDIKKRNPTLTDEQAEKVLNLLNETMLMEEENEIPPVEDY